MNLNVIIGMVAGAIVFLASVFLALGGFSGFFDGKSFLIVVGGSISALIVCFPFAAIKKMGKETMSKVIKKETTDYGKLVQEIVAIAQARRKGDSMFNAAVKSATHPFLKDAAESLFWADAEIELEEFRDLLETKTKTYMDDFKSTQGVYKVLGKFPPAFGMMGTVLGLIALLQSLGSPDAKSQIGPAMAVALITTLYGIAINNVMVIPLGESLAKANKAATKDFQLIIEGILLIQQKKPTKYIEEKLNAHLLPDQRPMKQAG